MKEKRVSVQVQRIIYIAEDGMEFTSEFMCKAHEAEMERDRLEYSVSALPRFDFTPEWADPDIVWKWYFARLWNGKKPEVSCIPISGWITLNVITKTG